MQDNAVISGKLKFISEELARSPFNYDLNSVAFASLEPESLLNVSIALVYLVFKRTIINTEFLGPSRSLM